jgi:transposase, IS30 family
VQRPASLGVPWDDATNQLNLDERCELWRLREAGGSIRGIGRELGRSPSTISRELRRNRPTPRSTYRPGTAGRMALARKRKRPKVERLSRLRTRVLDELAPGRSPEQITGPLRREGAEHTISHEAIYAYVFSPAGRRLKLLRDLASRKAKRGRRTRRGATEPMIPNRWPIHARPTKAHLRTQRGHWEGDLLHFRGQRAALLTLVERRSRFLLARRVADKRPDGVAAAVHAALGRLPDRVRRTITLGNGGEFHGHERFPLAAYFCDPHAPWQRGSVENANGVIRRSLPRHAPLAGYTDEDIEAMVWPEFAVGGHTSCGLSAKPLAEREHSRRARCRGGQGVHVGARIAAQAAGIADPCRRHTVPP